VQLRGTFSTKNNAMNTHFLHDRRIFKIFPAHPPFLQHFYGIRDKSLVLVSLDRASETDQI
jgi:hypothetical protein